MMSGTTATVVEPFTATRDAELSINVGDSISILTKQEDGWWYVFLSFSHSNIHWNVGRLGENNGKQGIFPSKCVSEKSTSTDQKENTTPTDSAAPLTRKLTFPHSSQTEKAVALHTFEGEADNELSFSVGAEVNVIDKSGAWWIGEINGKVGHFPGSFVTFNSQSTTTADSNEV